MSRLVVVSNRLADPRKPAAGGLAVALGETLKKTGGLWFGWSCAVVKDGTPGEGELRVHQAGPVTLAEMDLCLLKRADEAQRILPFHDTHHVKGKQEDVAIGWQAEIEPAPGLERCQRHAREQRPHGYGTALAAYAQ